MKRITIKRISAWSATKVAFVYYTALGLIFGGLIAPNDGLNHALVAALVYPVAGLIVSPIMAWLYNLAAWLTGGVAIDVQESRIIRTTTTVAPYEDERAAFTEK